MATSKTSSDVRDSANLIETLKSTILLKDARIERLETENRRLLDRLRALEGEPSVVAMPIAGRGTKAAPKPEEAEAVASTLTPATVESLPFLKTTSVRLANKLFGVYSDAWAGPEVRMRLIAEKAIVECCFALWLAPGEDATAADISIFLNGKSEYRARLPLGALSEIKFPLSIGAGKIFEIQIDCDRVVRPPAPDIRQLSYVIHSVDFV